METNIILQGDCLSRLKELPDESISCVVTSPPYWALRDYGDDGQIIEHNYSDGAIVLAKKLLDTIHESKGEKQ
jgi:DNA modification methylase